MPSPAPSTRRAVARLAPFDPLARRVADQYAAEDLARLSRPRSLPFRSPHEPSQDPQTRP
jgi:hypothetical protein